MLFRQASPRISSGDCGASQLMNIAASTSSGKWKIELRAAGARAGIVPSSQNQPPFFSQPGSDNVPAQQIVVHHLGGGRAKHLVIAQADKEAAQVGDRGVPAGCRLQWHPQMPVEGIPGRLLPALP